MDKATPDDTVKDLLDLFSADVAADKPNRDMQMDDLEAYIGVGQWDEADRRARESEERPILEQNQLPKYARQTIGDIREAEPSIKVVPDGDGADKDTARIYNGIIRQAQKRAEVSKPVIIAAEAAVICGIGNFRIVTGFQRDNPFHQEIGLEAIHNPLAVVWDANAREVTRSDAKHVFVREAMTRKAFKAKYKDARQDSFSGDEHDLGNHYQWTTKDTVTVAEHFEVGTEKAPYALLDNGTVIRLDRLPDRIKHNTDQNALFDVISQQAMAISQIKEGDARKVTWKKMTGLEILEKRDWLTGDIPVIAVVGEQIHFHDRTVRVSLIRYAKAAQKIYNYGVNAQLEMAMNAPKAPYLLGLSQLPEGKSAQQLWNEANKGNKPYLPYNDTKNPNRPVREPGPQPSSALQAIIFQAAEDLKSTTGIYDAALGNRSNETSGIAINARQREADVGTNLFSDNLEASLTHAGRIMIDLIPRIYDSERKLRLPTDDGSDEEVEINKRRMEGGMATVLNDLTVGRYGLAVKIGPSATTKRQEALQGMERILAGSPEMLAQFFDLWVEKMDFPGADAFVKRARKLLPPGITEAKDEEKTPEQQEAEKAALDAQNKEKELGAAKVEAGIRKDNAAADKAEAEARKTAMEADAEAIRNAIASGELDAAINARVVQIIQQVMAAQAPIPAL